MALPARDTRSLMPTPTPATTRYACWWTASTMFPRRRAFTLRSPAPSVRCFRRPPMADSRCEMLIRRPHVRETDLVPLGQHAFGISCLNTFGDLLWCFALHRKFASQLVIRHYGSRCRWIETDGCVDLWVIHEVTKL